MPLTQPQVDRFILLNEESNFQNSLDGEEVLGVAEGVGNFYKTLLAVSNRNRARRRIDVPEVL